MEPLMHCALVFCLFFCTGLAEAQASEKEAPAIIAAEKWLRWVDAGNYDQSWHEAAFLIKDAVPMEQWDKAIKNVRYPFGVLVSRQIQSAISKTSMLSAPDGEYVVIQFEASFRGKNVAIETVTMMLDNYGIWRTSGYYIKLRF